MAVIQKLSENNFDDYVTELGRHRRYKKDIKYIKNVLFDGEENVAEERLRRCGNIVGSKFAEKLASRLREDYGWFAFVDQKSWDVQICIYVTNVEELINEAVQFCKNEKNDTE